MWLHIPPGEQALESGYQAGEVGAGAGGYLRSGRFRLSWQTETPDRQNVRLECVSLVGASVLVAAKMFNAR